MVQRSRLLAVACIAASTLSYEILLVRIFAIEYFHHFAYMAIGVAMLGFGTSGTLLALFRARGTRVTESGFFWSATTTSVCLILSPTLVHQVTLDPTQLAWNIGQWFRLGAVYILLALPFAAGAMSILLAIVEDSSNPGKTYGASFVGSGLGALFALALLWWVTPDRALAVPALLAASGSVASGENANAIRQRVFAWVTLAASCFVFVLPLWRLEVSPYKALPQVEAYPDALRLSESQHPVGWVVEVDAPTFRFAPGLSLGYTGEFPEQTALFVDGQIAGATIEPGGIHAATEVFDWLPTALPYAIREPRQVLVIGAGGGIEVVNSITHGAARTVAVELHPELVRHGRATATRFGGESSVEWVVGDARSYLAQTQERFDVISIAPAGGFGSSAAGVLSLSEDFLHTTDAYEAYLRRLAHGGVLAITRWLTIPPRENVRVLLTVSAALNSVAPVHASDGIVVVRSWGTATVLAKPEGFTPEEIETIGVWAHNRRFDVDWRPDLGQPVSTYNYLEEPTLFLAAAAARNADSLKSFVNSYLFTITPVSDGQPYPHRYLRLSSLWGLLTEDRGAWLPFAEWGPIALVATLAQSTLLALLLLILPAVLLGRRHGNARLRSFIAYFLAIGFAYMAAEIAAIQQLSLLLGHPIYAVVVALAVFLICSGVGSTWSDRLSVDRAWVVNGALAFMLILIGSSMIGIVHQLQPAPFIPRALAAAVSICPLAFAMGIPFPHGLRLLVGDSHIQVAWAWAANGFASVVAAPLAALIALERGSPELMLFAALAYGTAGVLARARIAD